MKFKLLVYHLSQDPQEFVFEKCPVTVGRGTEADIVLEDRWVSRRHCEIHEENGVLIVRDLGSKHGTLLNETHIEEASLLPGDTLSIGLSTLVADYQCDSAMLNEPARS